MRSLLTKTLLLTLACVTKAAVGQTLHWQQTNGPYGGNISCFAVSSPRVYAGLLTGGVYRSTNNGAFWYESDSGLNRITVNALEAKGNFVYAATDSGLFRSTSSGDSWMRMNTVLTHWCVTSIAYSASSLFIGTKDSGIYRSRDQGDTWDRVNTGLINWEIYSLAVVGNIVLAGTVGDQMAGAYGGVWRSMDDGGTWSRSGEGMHSWVPVTGIMTIGTTIFAISRGDSIYRSSDSGFSWKSIPGSVTIHMPLAIAANGASLFAMDAGDSGLYHSTDLGDTWSRVLNLPSPSVRATAMLGSTMFAATDGGVFRSFDSGATWANSSLGICLSYVDAFVNVGDTLYAGVYGGGVYRGYSDNSYWQKLGVNLGNTYVRSTAVLGQVVFAGTDGGGLFASTGFSTPWTHVRGFGTYDTRVSALLVVADVLFAGTSDGVERSADSGKDWIRVDSLNEIVSLVDFGPFVFGGTVNGTDFSSDNGISWSANYWTRQDSYVHALDFCNGSLFAGIGGIHRSSDSGRTWTIVKIGPKLVSSIINFGSTIFAGTQNGVYFSGNKGDSWTQANDGLRDSSVYALGVIGTELFAGTKSGGVYRADISWANSAVAVHSSEKSAMSLQVRPNPVSEKITLTYDSGDEKGMLTLYNALGERMLSCQAEGTGNASLNMLPLPAGMYMLQLRCGAKLAQKPVMVLR